MPPTRLRVRVQPRASRNAIDGVREGVLRLRVTAPPVGGEANQAAAKLLAKALNVPRSRIQIVRGHAARDKTFEIDGVTSDEVSVRLAGRGAT